ncbi:DNA restriction methylase, partial [Salmonella enterica subsp. enterica serovar Heidelberg str. CVM24359]
MSSLDSEAKPDNAGHSVLALTTSHSLVVSSPETFLPDMRKELGIIADLVESYNDELCLLKLMAVQFKTHNHQKLYSYLSGYNHSISEADALFAENALRSEYWKRVMALTDVLPIMSDAKRNEWDKQFTADRYIMPPQVIPDFTADAVVGTVVALLNDRNQFIKE